MLDTTAQRVHGVELSKDQTGVTAKIPSSNVTVFFDGYTAHVAGTENEILSGQNILYIYIAICLFKSDVWI